MKIAVIADPELPVPPQHYGGIERVIHLLVEGLVRNGHEVVLFAHRDSQVSCELVPYAGLTSSIGISFAQNMARISRRLIGGGFDVVHSFGRLMLLAPVARLRIRKLMSYQRPITPSSITRARRLFGDTIEFTACSRHMTKPVESLATWHIVYNGVPVEAYDYQPRVDADAPVMFLGRLEEIKGPHLAIQAAREAGRRIVLAGNVAPEHRDFFHTRIRPLIDDTTVRYIGPVNDRQKSEWLGRSAALMMPILWDEPFGIVMAEALACGTPVIGLSRGSVPEVVDHGVTGFVASDRDGLVDGIRRLSELDRGRCRASAEIGFSGESVLAGYESLYARGLEMAGAASRTRSNALS
jgi:glycosyltransferase involved in cell wall biosynthesis